MENKDYLNRACDKAKLYVSQGKPWALAIHKAAEDFNLPTREISAEFKARREARKTAKQKYNPKLPDYVLKGKDWE